MKLLSIHFMLLIRRVYILRKKMSFDQKWNETIEIYLATLTITPNMNKIQTKPNKEQEVLEI